MQAPATQQVVEAQRKTERVDGLGKVTGRTRYVTDLVQDDVLYLRIVRSPHAHALIKSVDVTAAERLDGVVRVVTADDVPGSNYIGYFIPDQPLFCKEKVRFIGDAVAMVVADSPETAELGVQAVHVEYEPLPGIFDPEEALRDGAIKIHESGNRLGTDMVKKGDVERGFREADLVLTGTYKTPVQEQAYLETEAALAYKPDDDGITVVGSVQNPFRVRKTVKRVLGDAVQNVRIIAAPTGGAFGGKEDASEEVCARVALASYLTKRPSLLAFSRNESMVFHSKRHPMTIKREMGVTKDGKLTAVRVHVVADGGAYASLSSHVLSASLHVAAGAYDVPNLYADGVVTYSNNVPNGAFRGFGKPQALFAAELQMDEAAEKLGMDPAEFRLKNILTVGSIAPTGQKLTGSVGLKECLLKSMETARWKVKRSSPRSRGARSRGIGMACMIHPTALGAAKSEVSAATVGVEGDGSVTIKTGLTEYGQGIHTGYANIVRRSLGLVTTKVNIGLPDTLTVLDSGTTNSSRGTAMGGKAVLLAAQKLRESLAKAAAELLSEPPDTIVFENDRVYSARTPDRKLTLTDLASHFRGKGMQPKEDAWYRPSGVSWDSEKGQGSWVSFSFAVHVAEVEVDRETGKVNLMNYVAAHDSGTVIALTQFKSQVYGGVVQGLGYALMEELLINKGKIANPSFLDYYIPTASDVSGITPIIVEEPDESGPFGAKGIGEPPIEPVAAAVGNAVYNALGFPVKEFPFTAERVHRAILSRGR